MNFEDFVNKTNIKDIAQEEFRKPNKDACTCRLDMEARLKFFYNYRTRTTEWHKNGIKNLEFLECDHEQDPTVPKLDFTKVNHDGSDEYRKELIEPQVRDIGVQCDLIERSDKGTNTSGLPQAIQGNAADGHGTNDQSAGNTTQSLGTL